MPFLRRSLPLLRRSMQQRPNRQQPATATSTTASNPSTPGVSLARIRFSHQKYRFFEKIAKFELQAKRPAPGQGTALPPKQQVIKQEAGNQVFQQNNTQGQIIRRHPITPRPPGSGKSNEISEEIFEKILKNFKITFSAPTIKIVNKPVPQNVPIRPVNPMGRPIPGRPMPPHRQRVSFPRSLFFQSP